MTNPPIFPTTEDLNEKKVIALNNAINNQAFSSLHTFFAAGFTYHPSPEEDKHFADAKQTFINFFTAFPDYHSKIIGLFSYGDWIAAFYLHTGTFTGVVPGWPAPTGNAMKMQTSVLAHFNSANRQTESWIYDNPAALFQ